MRDAELITSMIIVLKESIVSESPTFVDNVYMKYDKNFDDIDTIENKLLYYCKPDVWYPLF